MNRYVADTMAIVLYLENRRLPAGIKNIFDDTAQGKCTMYFSAVSLMEIGYLFEKQRIDTSIEIILRMIKENNNFIINAYW